MRSRLPLALVAVATAAVGAGCPAAGDQVHPPSDEFFFPTGIALSPDDRSLFVLDANSDLRYDSGALQVVDLEAVGARIAAWLADGTLGDECVADSAFPTIMQCPERTVIDGAGSVRLGNFATDVGVQALDDGALRLFAAVRGDPSTTWIDVGPDRALACGGGEFHECDDAHRLTQLGGGELDLPPEPFELYVNSTVGFVVTTHLCEGAISVVDAPTDGAPPVLSDAIGGLFSSDDGFANCPSRAAGVAGLRPGEPDDVVYVTSATDARVQTLSVVRPAGGPAVAIAGGFFFTRGVLPSDDGRSIGVAGDGRRAYIINRSPPVLQIIDTSTGPGGAPKNDLAATVELCAQASNLAVADPGGGERVYVSCFGNGQVWVIDPVLGAVEAIVDVGRGPQGLAVSTANGALYVSNHLEDTIAIVDLRPGAPTENRVVARLGRPRPEGAD